MAEGKSEASSKSAQAAKSVDAELIGQFRDAVSREGLLKDVERGITHIKIEAHEIGNIPGLMPHWRKDLERRKREILAWEQQGMLKRMANMLRKEHPMPAEVSGEELLFMSPSKEAQKLVKQIRWNLLDYMSRLELVSLIGRSAANKLTLEECRTLLLQAIVACSLGTLDTLALKIVLWAQDNYLNRLYLKCKEQVSRLESRLEGARGTEAYQLMRNQVRAIQRNMRIIKGYQKHISRSIQEGQASFSTTLTMEEVMNFLALNAMEKNKEHRDLLLKKSREVIFMVRYVPLLHRTAHEYLDQLVKVDNTLPLPYFLKARVGMSALVFAVARYEGGEHETDVVKLINDTFKETYHHYGLAVKRIGSVAKAKTDFTILIEYASALHYFYKVNVHVLKIKLPKEWLATAFPKAQKALTMAQESGKIGSLEREIYLDMDESGLLGETQTTQKTDEEHLAEYLAEEKEAQTRLNAKKPQNFKGKG